MSSTTPSPRRPTRRRLAPASRPAIEQMVHALLMFLMDAGLTRRQLDAMLARAVEAADAARGEVEGLRRGSAALASVLFAWHRHPDCVDAAARPRPLRLRGKDDSIEALIVQGAPGAARDVTRTLAALRTQKLIRRTRDGRYLPSHHVATLRQYGPEVSGYVGEAILNLMQTIQSNLRPEYGSEPLIERAALVRDLLPERIDDFRSFVQEQGSAFVANVDEWLESNRARSVRGGRGVASLRRRSHGLTAGVHVFAFTAEGGATPQRATPRGSESEPLERG